MLINVDCSKNFSYSKTGEFSLDKVDKKGIVFQNNKQSRLNIKGSMNNKLSNENIFNIGITKSI